MNTFKRILALFLLLFSFSSYFTTTYAVNPVESQISEELKESLDKIVDILAAKRQTLWEERYNEFVNSLELKLWYLYFEIQNMNGNSVWGWNNTGLPNWSDIDVIMEAIKNAVFVEVWWISTDSQIDSVIDMVRDTIFSSAALDSYVNEPAATSYTNYTPDTNYTQETEKTEETEETTSTNPSLTTNTNTTTDPVEPAVCEKDYWKVCYKNEEFMWASNTCKEGPTAKWWIYRWYFKERHVWIKRLWTKCE